MQESSEHLTLPQELASGGTKLVNKVLELINVGPCVVDVKVSTAAPSLSLSLPPSLPSLFALFFVLMLFVRFTNARSGGDVQVCGRGHF